MMTNKKTKKIVVIGAKGGTGVSIVKVFEEAGYEVLGIDIMPHDREETNYRRIDVPDGAGVHDALAGAFGVGGTRRPDPRRQKTAAQAFVNIGNQVPAFPAKLAAQPPQSVQSLPPAKSNGPFQVRISSDQRQVILRGNHGHVGIGIGGLNQTREGRGLDHVAERTETDDQDSRCGGKPHGLGVMPSGDKCRGDTAAR